MIKLPEKAERPTMYFVGVTTGQSSIMKVFPVWAKELGIDAVIKGIDLPIHAPAEDYRAVAAFIKEDPLSLGALVTTHKIDMYNAASDMFDYLDPYAVRFGELSSISKDNGKFCAHAKDPISSGLALDTFVPEGHFLKTNAQVCILGAGGSALSISAYLANAQRHGADLPKRIHLNNRSVPRLAEAMRILEFLEVPMSYHLCRGPALNDEIVESLPGHGITMDEKRRKADLALESMKPLMKVAEDNGVYYCCEVVNRFEQYLLNTAQEGVEFVRRLDSPNAKVLLDTFHMNIEEDDLVQAILAAGDALGHFHVGERNRKPPGSTNSLPWADMAAALKKIGYQGAVVMEPFVLMGGSIPYDIKVWRDLSGGADEAAMDRMAADACRFLRDLTT